MPEPWSRSPFRRTGCSRNKRQPHARFRPETAVAAPPYKPRPRCAKIARGPTSPGTYRDPPILSHVLCPCGIAVDRPASGGGGGGGGGEGRSAARAGSG